MDPSKFLQKGPVDQHKRPHLKLIKPRSISLLRNKFFSRRVVDHWNSLPEEVVEAETVNAFKASLDDYQALQVPAAS